MEARPFGTAVKHDGIPTVVLNGMMASPSALGPAAIAARDRADAIVAAASHRSL